MDKFWQVTLRGQLIDSVPYEGQDGMDGLRRKFGTDSKYELSEAGGQIKIRHPIDPQIPLIADLIVESTEI